MGAGMFFPVKTYRVSKKLQMQGAQGAGREA
jgi:hypothetical protein